MNILVIDSGISEHSAFKNSTVRTTGFDGQNCLTDVTDASGHGTAVSSLIVKDIRDIDANIYVLKLFNELFECEIESLIRALAFIVENNIYDIINMSFGVVTFNESNQIAQLEKYCQHLCEQGSILISAFDNDGAISYPAFFDCVIGVDPSEKVFKRNEYEYVNNSCVNIMAYGGSQKVAWNNPSYTVINGSSLACANVTNVVLKLLASGIKKENIMNSLKTNSMNQRTFEQYVPPTKRPVWISGMKAIILPFNKEMHSLLAFEDMLDFEIIDVYDIKYTTQVGKNISQIVNYRNVKDRIIKNYLDIAWASPSFNAVIVGHIGELSSLCKDDFLKSIIDQCIHTNKKIFALDDLRPYTKGIELSAEINNKVYYPSITRHNIPKGRFGKLHSINVPVLAVVGTSSSQGKFTVQLSLREDMIKQGYHIGQMGSEPTAYCYNMDFVYPYGYNSTTYTSGFQNMLLLNQALHEMDIDGCDLCIVGTQANTAFYGNNNLENIPLQQLEILYGTMPDAFVLVINTHDDMNYITRTLKGTEYLLESKCVAIVIYPIMKKQALGSIYKKENIADAEWYITYKQKIEFAFNLPVMDISDVLNSTSLADTIIKFFSEQAE